MASGSYNAMKTSFSCVGLIAGVVLALFASSTVSAQTQEPTELNTAAQEAPTDDDGFVAKAKRFADETQILERLNGEVDGWYPRLGGMTTGSGFAFGPGYRTHIRDVFVDVSAAGTFKGYKAVDLKAEWLQS